MKKSIIFSFFIAFALSCSGQADFKESAEEFSELKECFSFANLADALKSLSSDFHIVLSEIENATSLEDARKIAGLTQKELKNLGDAITTLSE